MTQATAHEHNLQTGSTNAPDAFYRVGGDGAHVGARQEVDLVTPRTDLGEPGAVHVLERDAALHGAIGQLGDAP